MLPHLTTQSPNESIMIITYLGRNVKDYKENFLRYLDGLNRICPECGGEVVYHATYERRVHIDEMDECITIQRVLCKECRITHAVIPDFIRPYKHYSASDCEMVLRDIDNGISAEHVETNASVSTIRRWRAEFREKGSQVAGALKALLFRLYDKAINEVVLYGLKLLGRLERIIGEFPEIESSNLLMGDINIWLTNNMTGMFL